MSVVASLAVALAIGVGFGAALEQGGLGEPRKLAGQFYLRDFTVLKVMFSALVTAMLGVFWLDRLHLVRATALFTPETYLAPQLAGGVVFGVGFVLSGLCPGTACVAAASGRRAGLVTVAGVFAGVLATGMVLPLFGDLRSATPRGVLTWPRLLGVPTGWVVGAVTLGAVALFAAVERFERARRP